MNFVGNLAINDLLVDGLEGKAVEEDEADGDDCNRNAASCRSFVLGLLLVPQILRGWEEVEFPQDSAQASGETKHL